MTLLKKPKRGSFVKWCISIFISRIFNIRKMSSSMQWCKKKNVCGLLWALSGEESICDSLMVYMNCCFRILKIKFVLDFENMAPFHLAAKFGHFLLFTSLIKKFSNGWFWLLNGVESKICRGLHFKTAYITEINQF